MKHLRNYFSILFLLSLSIAAHANTGEQQLRAFLKNNKSFSASFTQSLFNEFGYELQFSSGKFSLQKPGKFSWDYEEPYPQVIMSNGKVIWMYDSELEQVTIKPVDASLSNTSMVLLFSDADIDKEFNILKLDVKEGVNWLELTSRKPSAEFSHILLGMKDNLLVSIKLVDGFNQTTEIKFSNISTSPDFSSHRFEFKIPKNVDVIGGE